MTGADKPRATGDPCEGSVHPFVVDPLSMEGLGIGPSAEELNKLKLKKQVMMNFGCIYLVFCVLKMCHSPMHIMQILAGYISAPLSAIEMELVTKLWGLINIAPKAGARGRSGKYCMFCLCDNVNLRLTAALTLTDREEDLQECLPKLVPLWGLINIAPKAGARGRSGKYCIGNLTMEMFTELLRRWQRTYPNLCWITTGVYESVTVDIMPNRSSSFANVWTNVTLYNKGRISGIIWDGFKAAL
ncbi:LOW QUALITY PROTEIN: hypothetical protein Cgig2_019853 [Carnegiea gigantea]|uniref:Uncharacterized protein n=1 Tax=Carnegiea gigantea TaxID=171969 RepID=A0A9Q1GJB1_9CARY|nr:LOW QUALITY PROTEIN: hypothetical protein Cgig2_019853 [Carnegiea gigantea]